MFKRISAARHLVSLSGSPKRRETGITEASPILARTFPIGSFSKRSHDPIVNEPPGSSLGRTFTSAGTASLSFTSPASWMTFPATSARTAPGAIFAANAGRFSINGGRWTAKYSRAVRFSLPSFANLTVASFVVVVSWSSWNKT